MKLGFLEQESLYFSAVVMGNVSGKGNGDEAERSGTKNEEEEEYMEYAQSGAQVQSPGSMVQYSPLHSPRAYQSSLIFTPQVSSLES